jgi:hypothetical protein
MLGPLVVQEDVYRSTRRPRHALGRGRVVGGHGVRAASSCRLRHLQSEHQVGQPVRVGLGVGVYVRHDLALCMLEPQVAGPGEPEATPTEQTHRELTGDLGRRVGGPVVHHQDPIVRVVQLRQRLQALPEGVFCLVGADDHGCLRPLLAKICRPLPVVILHDLQSQLRLPVLPGYAEVPTLDLVASYPPIVGPGEDAGSREPEFCRHLQLPSERIGLAILARARVEAHLGQEQGSIPCRNL